MKTTALILAILSILCICACTNDLAVPDGTTLPQTSEALPETTLAPVSEETTAQETAEETTPPEETASEPEPEIDIDSLPRTVYGGAWSTSHVQGIAIDSKCEYMYFSFTTKLVKTDMQGNVVGTVDDLPGHLGDLDYNPEDGRVYGSLELKSSNTFYIAIFDAEKIDRVGMDTIRSGVMTVVALPEVNADFTATASGLQYRYGCSGIDGVAFGPDFGSSPDSESRLMVAYGIWKDNARTDNDYQVILSFDWRKFAEFEKSYKPGLKAEGVNSENRYFVYTGNTNYGVQNLEYDPSSDLWFMAAYVGSKPSFPNYALFAVDNSIAPYEGDIIGQPAPEKGLLLTLADMGLKDDATGIRGWNFGHADTGIIALGEGYFYISHNSKPDGKQDCTATLYRWVGGEEAFEQVK